MKPTSLFTGALLVRCALSQSGYVDERTTKDCTAWVDIEDTSDPDQTCESTRRFWKIDPPRLRAWNPSVGLDCSNWFNGSSYCVETSEVAENAVHYSTATVTGDSYTATQPLWSVITNSAGYEIPATKSGASMRPLSTLPAVPAPSTWVDKGCFVNVYNWDEWTEENSSNFTFMWNLIVRYTPSDPKNTVDKCKQHCWDMQYHVAGVTNGDECWCGDVNNATRANDQAECNTPCGGNAKEMCGGPKLFKIFEASMESSTAAFSASSSAASSTASSAARRNVPSFGLFRWW